MRRNVWAENAEELAKLTKPIFEEYGTIITDQTAADIEREVREGWPDLINDLEYKGDLVIFSASPGGKTIPIAITQKHGSSNLLGMMARSFCSGPGVPYFTNRDNIPSFDDGYLVHVAMKGGGVFR
jgi:hypothetical protein